MVWSRAPTSLFPMQLRKSILLILIVLGLVAIAASLYVQFGVPYMQEKALQKLDEGRIADITALDTATEAILSASSTMALGTPNTVYISLPSATSTCADIELPSLPDGWSYHCAGAAELSKTDGTGWLPIDFRDFRAPANSGYTNILENVGMLPIDPVSDAGSLNYYAFVTGTSSTSVATSSTGHSDILKNVGMSGIGAGEMREYVLTAVLDSKKYLKEIARADAGVDPIRLELGSPNFAPLSSASQGLVGYWSFLNTNNLFADVSGNNNNGAGYYITSKKDFLGNSLFYDGENANLRINNSDSLNIRGNLSLAIWLKPNQLQKRQRYIMKNLVYDLQQWEDNSLRFAIYNPQGISAISVWFPMNKETYTNRWHMIVATWNTITKTSSLYIDGKLMATTSTTTVSGPASSLGPLTIGSWNNSDVFSGNIGAVEIYNRTLTAEEIDITNVSLSRFVQ